VLLQVSTDDIAWCWRLFTRESVAEGRLIEKLGLKWDHRKRNSHGLTAWIIIATRKHKCIMFGDIKTT